MNTGGYDAQHIVHQLLWFTVREETACTKAGPAVAPPPSIVRLLVFAWVQRQYLLTRNARKLAHDVAQRPEEHASVAFDPTPVNIDNQPM